MSKNVIYTYYGITFEHDEDLSNVDVVGDVLESTPLFTSLNQVWDYITDLNKTRDEGEKYHPVEIMVKKV